MVVGRVVAPSGLRGEVKVQPLTERAQRFSAGSVLHVGGKPTRVRAARQSKRLFVMALEGVEDRTAAESLRGAILSVPRSEVPPLPEGSYYHFQIVGMRVYTESGEYLGDIGEILPTGGNDVYLVKSLDGKELLIPSVSDSVVQVIPNENKMIVCLPEGLP